MKEKLDISSRTLIWRNLKKALYNIVNTEPVPKP